MANVVFPNIIALPKHCDPGSPSFSGTGAVPCTRGQGLATVFCLRLHPISVIFSECCCDWGVATLSMGSLSGCCSPWLGAYNGGQGVICVCAVAEEFARCNATVSVLHCFVQHASWLYREHECEWNALNCLLSLPLFLSLPSSFSLFVSLYIRMSLCFARELAQVAQAQSSCSAARSESPTGTSLPHLFPWSDQGCGAFSSGCVRPPTHEPLC